MNVYEMEGFLRGKCLPGDMKVNESDAQYLVRKFSELQSQNADMSVHLANAESKCRELAAENSAIKVMNDCLSEEMRGYESDGAFEGPKMHLLWWKTETPATDAFLAEVRAQGVEIYADNLDSSADDAERDGFDDAVKFLRSEASGVRLFAANLRKGVRS
ncbi:TPA: hypothetical protein KHV01_002117 [Escherichia coli]|uniref:hypothetical protein n=1 Tax=Escherichia coli TaxID=562 RepID=UPI001BB80940|nr:hypothetical protein [Escherichia coli]EHT5196794.1 hypothetical protein [Escherichia coli]MCX3738895.1 hypothetical protein [Escherichia coli]HAX9891285.1 hypothetical protein [Escherichia coli]HBD1470293.1 hypothetical protein [Escherichia coli]